MFKALTVVLLGVALLVTMKDGRALRDTGLIATCTAVSTPAGEAGYWEACRPGKLEGRPEPEAQVVRAGRPGRGRRVLALPVADRLRFRGLASRHHGAL